MTVLLPAHVHAAVVAMRGRCIDLEGVTDIPTPVPARPAQPVTINELVAGWQCAMDGFGLNIIRYPNSPCGLALTLCDIATGSLRVAMLEFFQVAYIEGEPTSLDLTDRDAATLRLARYGWLRPARTGIAVRSQ